VPTFFFFVLRSFIDVLANIDAHNAQPPRHTCQGCLPEMRHVTPRQHQVDRSHHDRSPHEEDGKLAQRDVLQRPRVQQQDQRPDDEKDNDVDRKIGIEERENTARMARVPLTANQRNCCSFVQNFWIRG